MKLDREMAIEAMQNLGWTVIRGRNGKTPVWKFTRPDTGGLWDAITVRQDQLSMFWVSHMAMQYGDAPDLTAEINAAKDRWLNARFLGIFKRAADGVE